VGLAYDNANRRTTLTLPNGVKVSYTYDLDSRVTGLTYAMGSSQLGNLTYTYDADGRVTAKAGSLAAVTLPAAVSGTTFNAANEMTGFNGATLNYDANGNLIGDGTNTFTWDARNHLSAMSGGATASFIYDAFGRRASKSINGTVTQFLYDGLNPAQELNGNVPPSPTANLLTGLDIDEYFTRTDTSGAMSFLTHALGSAIALTDSGGSINTSYTYEPFGYATVSGPNANPYQFTGRENDGTGLLFYRARYYSPAFQRFIAQDPIGFNGGDFNLYGYTRNQPTNLKDPNGTQEIILPPEGGIDVAPQGTDLDPLGPQQGASCPRVGSQRLTIV
jgi:RHS repeat-associated protein